MNMAEQHRTLANSSEPCGLSTLCFVMQLETKDKSPPFP